MQSANALPRLIEHVPLRGSDPGVLLAVIDERPERQVIATAQVLGLRRRTFMRHLTGLGGVVHYTERPGHAAKAIS